MTKKYLELLLINNNISDETIEKKEETENELIVHRDALIKRFEFCYDLTWKFYKVLLNKKYAIDVASPKKVFQFCYQQNVFTSDEVEIFFAIIDARNETTHVYDEALADKISSKIGQYTPFLLKMLNKIIL